MPRLPQVGGDDGNWGGILNDYLGASIDTDGTLKSNVVGSAQLKPGAITAATLPDGIISEAKLDTAAAAKLNTSGGVTDHGALTGLADDDHTQYFNAARGDARYYTQAQVNALISNQIAPLVARVVYNDGTSTWPVRPSAAYVEWVGSVDPGSAAQNGDTWIDTSS